MAFGGAASESCRRLQPEAPAPTAKRGLRADKHFLLPRLGGLGGDAVVSGSREAAALVKARQGPVRLHGAARWSLEHPYGAEPPAVLSCRLGKHQWDGRGFPAGLGEHPCGLRCPALVWTTLADVRNVAVFAVSRERGSSLGRSGCPSLRRPGLDRTCGARL